MEHIQADKKSWTYLVQRIMDPIWPYLADNCHLTKQPWINMEKAGFNVDCEFFQAKLNWKFAPIRPHCMGIATKPLE